MDDTVTTPEIKSTTISASKMMGREVGGGGNISGSQGKESKIGKLSRILRTTRIKVNDVETKIKDSDKRIKINAEKITRIKNIFKEQKSTLAENLSSLDQTAEFASVEKGLDAIIETLRKERKAEEKAAEAARRKKEKDRAKSREKKLESGLGKGIKKVVGKVVKPFKSIFDKIFGFLLNVLVGRTIVKLIDWFGDEKNKKKIKTLIRFVKDWWPALTAAVLLFGTGFGALAGGLVSIIGAFIPKLLAISAKLAAAIATNPFAIGAGLFLAPSVVPALFPQTVKDKADKQADKAAEEKGSAQAAEDIRNQKNKTGGGLFSFLTSEQDERREQAERLETGKEKRYGLFGEIKPKGMKDGGKVPGSGPNKDTVPAMLAPGEFVVKREAVQKYGVDTLTSMNSMTKSLPSYEGGGAVDERKFGKKSESLMPIIGPPLMESKMSGMPDIGGGGTNAPTSQAKERTIDAGVIGEVFGAFKKIAINPQIILEKAKSILPLHSGEVKESSGIDVPGATADRQTINVSPKEYVITGETVPKIRYKTFRGVAALDKIVADADSNSTPAKLGMRSERMIPGAPMRSGPMINVVPMQAPAGGKEVIDPSGSILPNFSAGTGSSLKARSLGVIR